MKKRIALAAFLTCVALVISALAQTVPDRINYQGRLFDGSGLPVTGASVPMEFSLWDGAVTMDAVTDEEVWIEGTSPISLAHGDVLPGETVTVTRLGGSPVFESPRDYVVDYENGTITRSPSGFIIDGETIEIDYKWMNYGNELWSESMAVEVEDGLYSIALGSSVGVPYSVFSGPELFLQVSVGGETLLPRASLTSVPYAINAALLGGMTAGDFALASHSHDFSYIAGQVTDAQVPDDITIIYSEDAGSLDGLDSSAFALSGHAHDFAEITGQVTDAQVPDNITVTLAENSDLLDGLDGSAYVHAAGDTVTGPLTVQGKLQAQSIFESQTDAIFHGQIGLGRAPASNYGIIQDHASPKQYGAAFYGTSQGVLGGWANDPGNNYAYLGSQNYGVYARAGSSGSMSNQFAGRFTALSQKAAYGVYGYANGYSVDPSFGLYGYGYNTGASSSVYGVYGIGQGAGASNSAVGGFFTSLGSSAASNYGARATGYNSGSGDAYGAYFNTNNVGSGTHYGVYAQSEDYPAVFANDLGPDVYRVTISAPDEGVEILSGTSVSTGTRKGLAMAAANSEALTGIDMDVDGYSTSYYTYGIDMDVIGHNNDAVGIRLGLSAMDNARGIEVRVDSEDTSGTGMGIFSAVNMHDNNDYAYGVYSTVSGNTGNGPQYGVYGAANGQVFGYTYGVYGYAHNDPGVAYGVYGKAGRQDDYAGYFSYGKVRVGDGGTENHVNGSGDLFVADDVEVGGGYYYAASKTMYFSVPLVGQYDGSAGTEWDPSTAGFSCPGGVTCGSYIGVNLPHGAVVTAVRAWGNTSAASHFFELSLYRKDLDSSSNSTMAFMYSSDVDMNIEDATIANPTIDNENFSYKIYINEGTTRADVVRLYGIRIDYTVEGPQ